ncbi:hypothetical protein [Gimesia maris]|uniref:hypothetical protein n=1 Tax=Gimesia maris TaxID=122 RepID=UPI0012B95CD7|nr:hypothetical protein [Gimesia maris]
MKNGLAEEFAASLEKINQLFLRNSSTPKEKVEQESVREMTACTNGARLDQKSVVAEKEKRFGTG